MDNHDTRTRSYNMSCIKSKHTKPEEIVAKYLFSCGLRYRRNVKKLPGNPDLVLKKYNTVVFINGCFWHMHENCEHFVWPKSNVDYWEEKLNRNKDRDNKNIKALLEMGWKVKIIWECQLSKIEREKTLSSLVNEIKNTSNFES